MPDDDKRIIIDEDWKARVQREKEEARKQPAEAEQAPSKEESAGDRSAEASFSTLVSTLAAQTLFSLGFIAPEGSERVVVDVGQAKFLIDTLMMLRQKTKGNLTTEEESQLAQTVAELQRAYVARAQQAQEAALKETRVDPKTLKNV